MSGISSKISGEGDSRIPWIDALRGMAMMGIIMVNFPSINTIPGKEATRYSFISTTFDAVMAKANMMFLNGKVYPIFAMLFGLGMAIFMQQAAAKGHEVFALMRRRLGALFFIGLLHLSLVWWGDILLIYAGLGLAVLAFYRKSAATLVRWIIGLSFLMPVSHFVLHLISPEFLDSNVKFFRLSSEPDAAIHAIYQSSSFVRITAERIANYFDYALMFFKGDLDDFFTLGGYFCQIFALMLLGLLVGKNSWYRESTKQQRALEQFWRLALAVLLIAGGLQLVYPKLWQFVYFPLKSWIACFYVLSFIKAYRYPSFQRFAQLFIPVGKISMTVYLAHTTCASLLLYGYGLGYYGQVGPGTVIVASVIFSVFITLFAQQWVKKFRFGPFEWLWRGVTYGKLPALRMRTQAPELSVMGGGAAQRN